MITVVIAILLLRLVPIGTARWAVLLRAGQSPFEPRLVTVPDGLQTGREPHSNGVGSRLESLPPDTWTESGQTPILQGSVKCRASVFRLRVRIGHVGCARQRT